MFVYLLEFPHRYPAAYKSFRDAKQAADLCLLTADHMHWMGDSANWEKKASGKNIYWIAGIDHTWDQKGPAMIRQLEIREYLWGTPVKKARLLKGDRA